MIIWIMVLIRTSMGELKIDNIGFEALISHGSESHLVVGTYTWGH